MINWHFIEELEGAAVTTGYVPRDGDGNVLGNSGVTIASGFDIGQRSLWDLRHLGIHTATIARIAYCCEATGDYAVRILTDCPLDLESSHVKEIDNRARARATKDIEARWDRVRDKSATWGDLTDEQQTVVMSVAWQYGSLPVKCPRFWGRATAGRWDDVIRELRDFGDAYPTRRGKEADYLEGV